MLFLLSELTDDQPRIYTDNIQMTRWLQEEIQGKINATFGDLDIPAAEATFESSGDLRSFWTESVTSPGLGHSPDLVRPGRAPSSATPFPAATRERPHGVSTVLIPANGARLTLDGEFARGRPFPRQRNGRTHSTCALAFSESWTLPYGTGPLTRKGVPDRRYRSNRQPPHEGL